MLLQAKEISKSYSGETILENVEFQINEKERIGLIGRNGAGKTTFLKILTGELLPDSGQILIQKKIKIGYLSQSYTLDPYCTLWDEMNKCFSHLKELEQQLRLLEQEMSKEEVYTNEKRYKQVLQKYSSLQETFEEHGGYRSEAKIRSVLHGLGLGNLDWTKVKISELSGGQKTRASLAKLLLEEPELLILDEPTNYLDLDAMVWLEQFLSQYPGAFLIVSHDRYFLDRLVEIVYELENKRMYRYIGNYSAYVKQKAAEMEQLQKAYEQQQAEIHRMQEFIQRNLARASTSRRAQSRKKALEKMERIEPPKLQHKEAWIRFSPRVTSGRIVLEAKKLSIGYQVPLVQNLSFQIERGERIAILGANGLGKSTLLKTIAGRLAPLNGEIQLGFQVEIDYYDQEQSDLHPEKRIIDEIWDEHPDFDQTTIRSYLGQFLFQGDDVFKEVKDLSGGEKARLSLLKRLLNQANFLLLDEPTNHLDLASKERLEEALEDFTGTLLFVSHDRYFINRIATRIWELTPEGIKDYPGNYEWYLERKALESETPVKETKTVSDAQLHRLQEKAEQRRQKQRQQQIAKMEEEIHNLENEIQQIQEQLCQPEVYEDLNRAIELKAKLEQLEKELAEKTDQWVELVEET
jgi:ATP-binding cassette subfamily F protein 3